MSEQKPQDLETAEASVFTPVGIVKQKIPAGDQFPGQFLCYLEVDPGLIVEGDVLYVEGLRTRPDDTAH